MIKGVNLSPSEQLSLIIENTTNESKRLVQRLSNAYIQNPGKGLNEVWLKLGERFGSNAVVTQVHLEKLRTFPKIGNRENKQLQEFGDLLLESQCAKNDGGLRGLKILDEPAYLRPPFSPGNTRQRITSTKTEITGAEPRTDEETPIVSDPSKWCFLHEKPHPLRACRALKAKPYSERTDLLSQHRVCFRCVASSSHCAKDCAFTPHCRVCNSNKHATVLHPDDNKQDTKASARTEQKHGEEQAEGTSQQAETPTVTNRCTEVCSQITGRAGRSCAKICLANVYAESAPEKKIRAYVIIDDQSNYSLCRGKLFDLLNIKGSTTPYTLKTCSGVKETKGRRGQGLIIESIDQRIQCHLPTLTECDEIPNNREEIPTPQVAQAHPHLMPIAKEIPELDDHAEILLLVGRDIPSLHKVHESRNGSRNAPWGQRLELGWVVIGNACLNGAHEPEHISTFKTQVLHDGRPSLFVPCPNRFHVKHGTTSAAWGDQEEDTPFFGSAFDDGLARNVFVRTQHDNKPGTSTEDRRFLEIMEHGMTKDENGSWEAPLPLRHAVKDLPTSRGNAMKRLKSTRRTLERKPTMKAQYFAFMQKIFDHDHAELVPAESLNSSKPCWYLPHFGIYHPKKPDKIRVVFDSAAECNGISLNSLLLSGPDLTNGLLGVLLRFRQNPVAMVADIEQMFHSFKVKECHRDLLRFLWYENNDPNGEITEYRMKVHIFGNTSSPAVANYGLRKTAEVGENEFGSDAKAFVHRNFYVDDGLHSAPTTEDAIGLLRRTQTMLATANLRLHKVASSHAEVVEAFPSEDHASGLHNLDFSKGPIPVQRLL
ncbi:uncharacterized protein LOC144651138 [Oculina patagonica]